MSTKSKSLKLLSSVLMVGMLSACGYHGHYGKQYSISFQPGSSQLSKNDLRTLEKVAALAKPDTGVRNARGGFSSHISLSGHTDTAGNMTLNDKLSKKRMLVVTKELVRLGVSPVAISSQHFGEGLQKVLTGDNTSTTGNRRVDISVY